MKLLNYNIYHAIVSPSEQTNCEMFIGKTVQIVHRDDNTCSFFHPITGERICDFHDCKFKVGDTLEFSGYRMESNGRFTKVVLRLSGKIFGED